MIDLPRRLPDPLPEIHPLPEHAATGARAAQYEDMKRVLQVPWMGVVTMAYSHYPNFFEELWTPLRPLCLSRPFVAATQELRAFVESRAAELAPPPLVERLGRAGYGAREIDDIRATLEVFSHGNFLYLLIATMTRLLLAGAAPAPADETAPFEGRHAPEVAVPFVLMERHHADAATARRYDDIMATLGLPFVNTDYRALARWPSYFALAWADLKPSVGTARHTALADETYRRAIDLVLALPNPGGAASERVIEAARRDAPPGEIERVAALFHFLLPGLVVNVAFFRAQLA